MFETEFSHFFHGRPYPSRVAGRPQCPASRGEVSATRKPSRAAWCGTARQDPSRHHPPATDSPGAPTAQFAWRLRSEPLPSYAPDLEPGEGMGSHLWYDNLAKASCLDRQA